MVSTAREADTWPMDTAVGDRLHLPGRSLVVLAGLPGAGKTTLLRKLTGTDGVRALDSEDVAERLRRVPMPYRLLRPLVHALHLVQVAVALHAAVPCVLTTDPCTSPRRRRLLHHLARLSGRSLHVVLIDASPDEARDGRRRRGRDLSAARAARHERRYRLLPSSDVHCRLTRGEAARAAAIVAPETASPSTGPYPSRTKESSSMHAARRRPGIWIPALATLLGLWFGLTAPELSPVLPSPSAVAEAPQDIAVLGPDRDGPVGGTVADGDGGDPDGRPGGTR